MSSPVLDAAGFDPLPEFYRPLLAPGPVVIAQLGQSLDGFIATRTGHATFVTGPEDRRHLHVLRSLVDAVVVGAATVVADDCRLTVRDAPLRGSPPVRVVVDPRAQVPVDARVLREADAPTAWVVGQDVPVGEAASHVEVMRLPAEPRVDPSALVTALADRGLRRVLVEGGGRLVSAFVEAGEVDRLYLTTAPVLIGDGIPGLRFTGPDTMDEALRPPTRRLPLGDDLCTELLLRRPGSR